MRATSLRTKSLTILGVERRLFFLALVMGGATFNFFSSLLTGLLMFMALFAFGRWATLADSPILRILLNSSKFRSRYDPAKLRPGHLNLFDRDQT